MTPPTPDAFAAWLRRELHARGWDAEEFAARVGVVPGTVRAWLVGARHPEAYARPAVAAALGVPSATLPPRPRRQRPPAGPAPTSGFAPWLRAELAARGWTQSELAARAGVHPTSVSAWCAGRKEPRPDGRAGVARALGVPEAAMPPRPPERRKEPAR